MKSIEKPSFLRMFLIRSITLLLVFLFVSFVWVSHYAEKQRTKNFNLFLVELNRLEFAMKSIYKQESTKTKESKIAIKELQQEIDNVWMDEGIYISVYIHNEKIAETDVRIGAYPTLTESDVNYCYGYGNTSEVFDKTTHLYKLDKDVDFPFDVYGCYSVNYDKDTFQLVTATPYFPEFDWALNVAYRDDLSIIEVALDGCIAAVLISEVLALLIAFVWAKCRYKYDRAVWDILENRKMDAEAMANSLTSISDNLAILREGFILDPEPHYIAIEQNTDEMSRMVHEILGPAKNESESV